MFGEPKLTTPFREWLRKMGLGLAFITPWAGIIYELIAHGDITAHSIDQLVAWGPAAFVVGGFFIIADRWAPKIIAAQNGATAAQQKLADSVAQAVERGDRDARETIGLMRYMVAKIERMESHMDEVTRRLPGAQQ